MIAPATDSPSDPSMQPHRIERRGAAALVCIATLIASIACSNDATTHDDHRDAATPGSLADIPDCGEFWTLGDPMRNDPAACLRWFSIVAALDAREREDLLRRCAGEIGGIGFLTCLLYEPKPGAPPPPTESDDELWQTAEKSIQASYADYPVLWIEGLPFALNWHHLKAPTEPTSHTVSLHAVEFVDWATKHGQVRQMPTPASNPVAAIVRFEQSGFLRDLLVQLGHDEPQEIENDVWNLHGLLRWQAYLAVADLVGSAVRSSLGSDTTWRSVSRDAQWDEIVSIVDTLNLAWDSETSSYVAVANGE